ncbi:PREDICTED: chymotrypsin-2-like, partial [Ceratosolen solmsi marchali]|uniref:Chymotrypsin-2-like n=1 Tax=Ceratosolen solmsi marchali TaxID=326594 RepID=A0AAJ7DZL8_9HYME
YQIIIYICFTLGVGTFSKNLRIIGGSDADIREFPFFVSLRYIETNTIFCGGAIISDRHILTAAHCLHPHYDNFESIRIYTVVTSAQSTDGLYYTIEKVIYHPGFSPVMNSIFMNDNDVCVIKIKENIIFSTYQNKIDLPIVNIEDDFYGVLIGWGSVTYGTDNVPESLQKIIVRVINNHKCSMRPSIPFLLHFGQLCGFTTRGMGSYNGDSGGPLIHNSKVIGIVSFSIPFTQGYPDIFTKVHYYLNFIREAMRS